MADPASRHRPSGGADLTSSRPARPRLGLYAKFVLVMLPAFVALAAVALLFAGRMDSRLAAETLALRVGNLSARVAAAVGRHEAQAQPRLAEDFLSAFGAEPAVDCAVLREATLREAPIAAYPPRVGCTGAVPSRRLELPVGDDAALLVVHYDDSAIAREARERALILLGVLFAGMLVALGSASLGFRLIVARRLARWHRAIALRAAGHPLERIEPGSADELGGLIEAYNTLIAREREREAALREANERLRELSRRDPLTGLFNRRHFEAWATEDGDFAKRRRAAVLGLLDIDHFKSVNDTQGHAVGDEVLATLAQRLSAVMRPSDLVVRWGGEEFLILAQGSGEASELGRRLLDAVRGEPVVTAAGPLPITASIGLVRLPMQVGEYAMSIERAIVLADRALYAAKAAGRDRAVAVVSLQVRQPAQLALLEDDLPRAASLGLVRLCEIVGSDGGTALPAPNPAPNPQTRVTGAADRVAPRVDA